MNWLVNILSRPAGPGGPTDRPAQVAGGASSVILSYQLKLGVGNNGFVAPFGDPVQVLVLLIRATCVMDGYWLSYLGSFVYVLDVPKPSAPNVRWLLVLDLIMLAEGIFGSWGPGVGAVCPCPDSCMWSVVRKA